MKREELLALLQDESKTNEQKMDEIMRLNGIDITKEKGVSENYKTQWEQSKAEVERRKDYDDLKSERDKLISERDERAMTDRFDKVLGQNKPKNDFTRKGLLDAFKASVADEANKNKKDEDLFQVIIKDHEKDYFEGEVKLTIPPANPNMKPPTDVDAYLDEQFKNNPFYNKSI